MIKLSDIKGQVDFGILTIREDEFEAVLQRFPPYDRAVGKRQYNLSRVDLGEGASYLVAVVRCTEPGTGEALDLARDLLEDLAPRWLLVVGIGGGVPSDEFTLGDVVVSTRFHDFSVEAVLQDRAPEYALAGGPVHKHAAALAANLPALKATLGAWSTAASIGVERPPIDVKAGTTYGDKAWQARVKKALTRQATRPEPIVTAGAIASSDRLIKDTEVLGVWLKVARQVVAVEMESAGVYRAAHGAQVPVLAIRGISDIVGFKRDARWTRYACHTAAAFAAALLQCRPIEPTLPPKKAERRPRSKPMPPEPASDGKPLAAREPVAQRASVAVRGVMAEPPQQPPNVPAKPVADARAPVPYRVLFLGANPADSTRLSLAREVKQIRQQLREAPLRDQLLLLEEWAVGVEDLQRVLLEHKPTIVHFSGHGERLSGGGAALLVEDRAGKSVVVPPNALADLFGILGSNVRCVVLNACHSAPQAKAIGRHVDHVIGMSRSIGDQAAIKFSQSFYRALGYGESIEVAFNLGKNEIALAGKPDAKVPVLRSRDGADPAQAKLTRGFTGASTPPRGPVPDAPVEVAFLRETKAEHAPAPESGAPLPELGTIPATGPETPPEEEADRARRAAELQTAIEAILRRGPRLTTKLVELGYGSARAGDAARSVARALIKAEAAAVARDVADLVKGGFEPEAARELLWHVLPLAGDWEDVVEQARGSGGKRKPLTLRLRTETIAEIVVARVEARRCLFAPGGPRPLGASSIPMPSTSHAPLFDLRGEQLRDAVLINLVAKRKPTDPRVPAEDRWRNIKKGCADDEEFKAAAAGEINAGAHRDEGHYLLVIDAMLDPHGTRDLDTWWEVVQDSLGAVLPGLRLVRLKGRAAEMAKEYCIVPHVETALRGK